MTPKGVIEDYLVRQDSNQLQLNPGLSQSEIKAYEDRLGIVFATEARELLAFTSGFIFRPFGTVNFSGITTLNLEEVVPHVIALATDGNGNSWALDVNKQTGVLGPVVFIDHDPPVVVVQAPSLSLFLSQLLDLGRPECKNQIEYVTKIAALRIWREDPFVLDLATAQKDTDPVLRDFSRDLPANFHVADLRVLEIGSGFVWGHNGPNTTIIRCGSNFLFGIQGRTKQSLFGRIFKGR